ncbi:MAG: serine/threonine protein kinase [Desulfovibrio sp.]|nr:serine/threonine protein kinase [Desulfovibrio sp.]
MSKKQLDAAQGVEAACILFRLNSGQKALLRLAGEAGLPVTLLSLAEQTALHQEWLAFVHAVVTAGLMQHAPNSVLVGYLRETGHLLREAVQSTAAAPLTQQEFVDGPFAVQMALLGQGRQSECPALFCQRLQDIPQLREAAQDKRVEARLAALMALVISAIWDKLESYDILSD